MKQHHILYYVVGVCLAGAMASIISCTDDYDEDNSREAIRALELRLLSTDVNANPELRYFQNRQLPVGKDHLNVLCIGNSYTNDALANVNEVLKGAGILPTNYSIYCASFRAASLKQWSQKATTGAQIQLTRFAGNKMPMETGTLEQLLEQDWDVITLQQYSGDATRYQTFNPWLRMMIDLVRTHCTNPGVTIAWQTAWSYSEIFGPEQPSYNRWLYIEVAVQQMVMNDGVDVLIPIGTAIQNARRTSLNTSSELTRDGTHLDLGVGRYIAACTWVQSLFAPVFDFSVLGNPALPIIGQAEGAKYSSRTLTTDNQELCQRCAIAAVEEPFSLAY